MAKTIFQKILIKLSALFIVVILISPAIILITPEISKAEDGFVLLENYPGLEKVEEALNLKPGDVGYEDRSSIALGTYIDWIVKLSLGLLSIGAVITLVYAGITYIGSETWSKKSDAKDLILRSVGSLVLMFSAFIFFNQLNPELLKVRFKPVKTLPDKLTINSVSDIWDDSNFSNTSNPTDYGWIIEKLKWIESDPENTEKSKNLCDKELNKHKNDNKDKYEYKSCSFNNGYI